MIKYLLIGVYNLLLCCFLFYLINLSDNGVKVSYLPEIKGDLLGNGLEKVTNYEVNVEYIYSELPNETIVQTSPRANSLVYDNQVITIYVSIGKEAIIYQELENMFYDDCIDYLNEIKQKYNLEIIVEYREDENLLDNLIYKQKTSDAYIKENGTIELIVIKNNKTVELPDFVGWHYKDVILFANENKIKVEFEYYEVFYKEDCVVGQSVKPYTLVLKNSNPIIIYLSKGASYE